MKKKNTAIKKQKKIILFGLNGRGGMLHYTSQYANELSKLHQVYVVLPSYSRKDMFNKTVKIIKINAPPTIIGTIINSLNLIKIKNLIKCIKKIKPDILQFMDIHPFYLIYLLFLKKETKYSTIHDVKLHSGENKGITSIITILIQKSLFKYSKKLIVHGEKQKKDLISLKVKSKKIIVVPHGTYEFFTKWKQNKNKLEKNTILFFGRIIKYKGVDNLLKSMEFVIKQKTDVNLIIAGEGNFQQYSKYLTKKINKNVTVLNRYIPEEEVAAIFQKCCFVVLPYDDATQSGIIPIAYSFKKPVITTNVGSLSEVVDQNKTGIIIPPKSPKKLSEAILTMFKKNTTKMGENAYTKMKQMMDWNLIITKIFDEPEFKK
ncbi:glycosyltransferase family 4 protein [Candidatus Woesearchaeota archaeon]|nr:glycosyltransferase family 4 protein [Candidatus Woesearchaeota archaeon]